MALRVGLLSKGRGRWMYVRHNCNLIVYSGSIASLSLPRRLKHFLVDLGQLFVHFINVFLIRTVQQNVCYNFDMALIINF